MNSAMVIFIMILLFAVALLFFLYRIGGQPGENAPKKPIEAEVACAERGKKVKATTVWDCPFMHRDEMKRKSSCVSPIDGMVVPLCTQLRLPGGYQRPLEGCTPYRLFKELLAGANTEGAMRSAGIVTPFDTVIVIESGQKGKRNERSVPPPP